MNSLTVGATKILTGSILERLFWTIILVCMLVYFYISAGDLLMKFNKNRSITNNEIEEVNHLKLPTVTVCDVISYFCSQIRYKNSSGLKSCHKPTIDKMVSRFVSSSQCYKNRAYTNKSCEQKASLHHPGCIIVNPNQIIGQESPGRHTRARIRVTTNGQGLYLYFHSPGQVPSFVERFQHKMVSNYGMHDVIITRKDFNRLPAPYRSNCSAKIIDESNSFPYSKSLCQQTCIAHDMFDTLGTVGKYWGQYLPKFIKTRSNQSTNSGYRDETISKSIKDFLYNFHRPCECKHLCKETVYGAKVKQTSSHDTKRIVLTIYYDKLEILKSTELPAYDTTRFLADIGGLMGLVIGMSFLSVFEFIICLALYVVDFVLMLLLSYAKLRYLASESK